MSLPTPSNPYMWTFRRIVWATLVLAFVVFGFWLLYRFNQVVFILFIAIVIGTVIRPAVAWLYQHGVSRTIGVMLIYLLLIMLFTGFLFLLLPLITKQGVTITAALPGYYQSLRDWMANYPNPLISRLSASIPSVLPNLKPVQQTGEDVIVSAGQIMGYLSSAGGFALVAIVTVVLSYYWTLDGPRIVQSILMLVPQSQRETIRDLVSAMETKVGYYIAGQGLLCLIVGSMAFVSYLLIGLPNAFVLALVAGILEAVPMIGPLLGAVPASMIALSIGPDKLIWVIVATAVIQQLENSLLVPRIMSKAVGVNPFVTLLALFAFSSFFGIAGALMAIPLAAILQLVLNHFVFYPTTTDVEVSSGRDYVSCLRYEAQNLISDLRKQARLKKRGSDLRVKQIDQVMDEIETITTDLDTLLNQASSTDEP